MKLGVVVRVEIIIYVAPFTGAWIETGILKGSLPFLTVAPFTGAWIETELH